MRVVLDVVAAWGYFLRQDLVACGVGDLESLALLAQQDQVRAVEIVLHLVDTLRHEVREAYVSAGAVEEAGADPRAHAMRPAAVPQVMEEDGAARRVAHGGTGHNTRASVYNLLLDLNLRRGFEHST